MHVIYLIGSIKIRKIKYLKTKAWPVASVAADGNRAVGKAIVVHLFLCILSPAAPCAAMP
jgi:hypothetical protein